jgi:hypothetical protein
MPRNRLLALRNRHGICGFNESATRQMQTQEATKWVAENLASSPRAEQSSKVALRQPSGSRPRCVSPRRQRPKMDQIDEA